MGDPNSRARRAFLAIWKDKVDSLYLKLYTYAVTSQLQQCWSNITWGGRKCCLLSEKYRCSYLKSGCFTFKMSKMLRVVILKGCPEKYSTWRVATIKIIRPERVKPIHHPVYPISTCWWHSWCVPPRLTRQHPRIQDRRLSDSRPTFSVKPTDWLKSLYEGNHPS